ncbi:MAG: GNAT family N-acetyltransferase [Brotaphodocola sp.]
MRYLDASERKLCRELWEEAFPEDSESFCDYYFEEKLKDNRILVLEENRRIDAMIHRNPYLLQVKNQQWKIDYLVGVATRKDRRHRGYMRRLLEQMMKDMRNEHMPFCFLMPADEAIYRPFGFTFIYDQTQMEWKNAEKLSRQEMILWKKGKTAADTVEKSDWQLTEHAELMLKQISSWMNRWLADHEQVYTVRDIAYLNRLMKEIASEHGTFDMIFDGGSMIGVESFWGLEKKEQRLLYADDFYVNKKNEPKPAIMARIMDLEHFVSAVCLKKQVADERKTLILSVEDPLIPENHGVWKWTLDHETSCLERIADSDMTDIEKWQVKAAELIDERETVPELTLTITELTAWLFGYHIPEKANVFCDVVQPLQGVFLDEVV